MQCALAKLYRSSPGSLTHATGESLTQLPEAELLTEATLLQLLFSMRCMRMLAYSRQDHMLY